MKGPFATCPHCGDTLPSREYYFNHHRMECIRPRWKPPARRDRVHLDRKKEAKKTGRYE